MAASAPAICRVPNHSLGNFSTSRWKNKSGVLNPGESSTNRMNSSASQTARFPAARRSTSSRAAASAPKAAARQPRLPHEPLRSDQQHHRRTRRHGRHPLEGPVGRRPSAGRPATTRAAWLASWRSEFSRPLDWLARESSASSPAVTVFMKASASALTAMPPEQLAVCIAATRRQHPPRQHQQSPHQGEVRLSPPDQTAAPGR